MAKKSAKKDIPSLNVDEMVKYYEDLDPDLKTELRQKIMQRAGADESLRKSIKSRKNIPELNTESRHTPSEEGYEPFSEQIFDYLANVRTALSKYLPLDQYADGDEDRLDLFRKELINAIEPLEWLLKSYFRYEVKGLENIPKEGRAMIISNHGILPIDGWFLSYEVFRARGRWPRGLTDWRIYKMPWLRQFFMDMGTVVGSHKNGDRLLQNEQLIFIMPGGSREAWKSSQYKYRLIWQGRKGFIRLALRNSCPIIPSANVGTDDTYHVLFNGYSTAYKLFKSKKAMFPIRLPLGLGLLPFPVKMTQYVGEPITFPYPPEAEKDPAIVEECQKILKSKVYELIDRGLQEREGIF